MTRLAFTAALLCTAAGFSADPPAVQFATGKAIPKGGMVIVVESGKPGPGQKDHKAVGNIGDFPTGTTMFLAGRSFDLYYQPQAKGTLPVLVVAKWTPKAGKQTVAFSDHLGTVFVRGDDLPRADSVVVTATDDPGPGEKGHVAIQKAGDYKEDMVVPPGTYSVWVVPFNGAKAQRIADKVRVLAGREVKVPE